jgi:WD40 repeat protein
VLLDEEGHAYLSDFGIAARLADPYEPGLVEPSSPAYVAPERLEGEPPDPRSDLYCLGLLAFELLSGRRPPMDGALPSLHRVRPELPETLDGVIAKATAGDPADRHESVDAFLAAVTALLGGAVTSVEETFTAAENPYKGLRAFDETDAGDFFGRDSLVAELVRALGGHRLVAVVGPSGIGKSSVVKAGLVPALRGGALPGSESWVVTDMVPGSYPYEELSTSLLRVAVTGSDQLVEELAQDELGMTRVVGRILPPDAELVLVVDQFEELFTLTSDDETRRRFLDGLTQLVADGRSRVRVVLTLRADFLDQPLSYPEFGELLKKGMCTVTVPSEDELAAAIERPAASVGVHFEPGLVSRIVADVRDQPGALPLLQYALTELFAGRASDVLTLEGYAATGGVVGALGRRAEELYESLDRPGQVAARQIFLRLVTVDSQAQDTRRRVRRRDLRRLELDAASVDEILRRYGEHRLLTFDREPLTRSPTVEVAHEALLGQWARLRGWVDGRREDLLLHRRLVEAVEEWDESERASDYLPREGRLAQLESWADETDLALTANERDFLAAGRRQEDGRRRRTARRRTGILAGFAVAAAVSILLAVLALVSRGHAQDEARAAQAQELGARGLTDTRLDQGLLLARQGDALDPSLETYESLLAAELRAPAALAVLRPWEGTKLTPSPIIGAVTIGRREACVDVSPDGKTIAVGDPVRGLVLLDGRTYERLRKVDVTLVDCRTNGFSPDGSNFITTGFFRGGSREQVALISVDSGKVRRVPFAKEFPGPFDALALAYSRDGRTLLTLENRVGKAGPPEGGPAPLVAVPRSGTTGRVRAPEVRIGVAALAWARYLPGGREVVVSVPSGPVDNPHGPGRTLVLDARSLKLLRSFAVGSHIAALSPDGRTLALARRPRDDQVMLLDLRSDKTKTTTLAGRHAGPVTGVEFSPDGKWLVTTSADGSAIVWDARTRELREHLEAHTGAVFGPAFAPDGRTVFTTGLDESVIAWDIAGDRRLGRTFSWAGAGEPQKDGDFVGTALSPDGTVLFRGSPDGHVLALSVPGGRVLWKTNVWPKARVSEFRREVVQALRLPHGADYPPDRLSALWDNVKYAVTGWVQSVALNPAGTLLAVASHQSDVALLDAASGRVVRRWRANDFSRAGVDRGSYFLEPGFTADGRDVVTANDDGGAVIWDARTGQKVAAVTPPTPPDLPRYVLAALVSPDGRQLALFTGPTVTAPGLNYQRNRSQLEMWNVETGKLQWQRDIGFNYWVVPVLAASPDWSLLATGGFLREVRLWDARTGKQVGNPIPASEGFVTSVAFDPTGERLLTGGTDGTARLFDVASHQQIGASLPGDSDRWTKALFGPDSTSVLALSGSGRAWLWDLSDGRLRRQACSVANRILTEDEWRRFVPGRPYAPACRG